MKLQSLQKVFSWTAVHTAWISMSISPLAMAQPVEPLSKRVIEEDLKQIGYNRRMTVGEFWKKVRIDFPMHQQWLLDKYIQENKNQLMPEMEVTTAKGSDGLEIPVIKITQNGRMSLLQIIGEKKKWAKYNSVNLSEADLYSVTDAVKRIEASDINIRQAAERYRQQKKAKDPARLQLENDRKKQALMSKDFARFTGFPRLTPILWKKMSKEQRAKYIVNMRLLWLNARQVLMTGPVAPEKKSGQRSAQSLMIEEFYRNIFGEQAFAVEGDTATLAAPPAADSNDQSFIQATGSPGAGVEIKPVTPTQLDPQPAPTIQTTTPAKLAKVPYTAKACVVAGYIATYSEIVKNGKKSYGCSSDQAFAEYYDKHPELAFVTEANKACRESKGPAFVACNPILYGYPKGQEACVSKDDPRYQQATHYRGPCDEASPLMSTDKSISFSKDYSNIMPEEKRLAIIDEDQKKDDYKLTREFLEGVLTKKNNGLREAFDQGKWTPDLDNELVRIQSQFEDEIRRATETCRQNIIGGEKNQKLACDQLHRRWLFAERFISQLRSSACDPGAKYIGAYEDGQSSLAAGLEEKTKLNKMKIDAKGTNLCECQNVTEVYCKDTKVTQCKPADSETRKKRVSFGGKCEAVATVSCPEGMSPENPNGNDKRCVCNNSSPGMFTVEEARKGSVAKLCPAVATCKKPQGIANFDYNKCECKEGTLENENEPQFVNTFLQDNGFPSSEQSAKTSEKWVCKERNLWPWAIPPLIALALFFKHKKKSNSPAKPVETCKKTCDPKTETLDASSCSCKPLPPVQSCAPKSGVYPNCVCSATEAAQCTAGQGIYDFNNCFCGPKQSITCDDGVTVTTSHDLCPKCSNGSFRTPAGCPNENEGGSGNYTCKNPPCSGGVPVGQ